MAETSAWMPIYIGDYLADTMHLTGAEHGAYFLLILHYWRSGPLPDDDRALAAIARFERQEWETIGPVVRRFFKASDGLLHHKRIDFELAKSVRVQSTRRAAANARWMQSGSRRNAHASILHESDANASSPHSIRNDLNINSTSPTERTRQAAPSNGHELRDRLWQEGLPILRTLTGLPENRARGVLGKLVKQGGDDCSLVLAALQEAVDTKPIDPVPWLMKRVEPEKLDTWNSF